MQINTYNSQSTVANRVVGNATIEQKREAVYNNMLIAGYALQQHGKNATHKNMYIKNGVVYFKICYGNTKRLVGENGIVCNDDAQALGADLLLIAADFKAGMYDALILDLCKKIGKQAKQKAA